MHVSRQKLESFATLSYLTNTRQIADESIVSVGFNIFLAFMILGLLGVDINALFIFLSGLLVSFAFMIGSASAKYLEVSLSGVFL